MSDLKHITPAKAARLLGCDVETIRIGLRNGTFPIGCAIAPEKPNGRWVYLIPSPAFMQWYREGYTLKDIELRLGDYVTRCVERALKELIHNTGVA